MREVASTSGKNKGKQYNAAYVPPADSATHKRALDGTTWTPTEKRRKDKLMRQFMHGTQDGNRGNSRAYQDGWERTFGGRRA